MDFKKCPICDQSIVDFKRYPNMVCQNCSEKTVTKDGIKIEFYNKDFSGGFISVVNDKKGDIHECYIDNKKCYADESRFGGIVIQLID